MCSVTNWLTEFFFKKDDEMVRNFLCPVLLCLSVVVCMHVLWIFPCIHCNYQSMSPLGYAGRLENGAAFYGLC